MKKHALLSASGAHRWMVCTPSARMGVNRSGGSSPYADEGTLAHELAVHLVRERVFGIKMRASDFKPIEEHELYSEEMYDYVSEYAEYVYERLMEAKPGAQLFQEQKLGLIEFIPEGFGTTDICIVADDIMDIIDLKYGKGVPVDATENEQLMVYGLGALEEHSMVYDIKTVRLTVYQPRINNISTYELPAKDLRRWGYEVLRPIAIKAYQGIGDYVAGEHCKFCAIRATCKTAATYHLEMAKREFDIPEINPQQMSKLLLRIDAIKKWLTAVENFALDEAIRNGVQWPGMKVVKGRSVRKYSDENKVYNELKKEGFKDEDILKPTKIIGITELQKRIGKSKFDQIVAPLLIKPDGKPTLVSELDNRPAWDSAAAASLDFNDEL